MAYRRICSPCSPQIVLLIGLLLIGASLPTGVRAEDRTWDNDAGDNDWLNSANWVPDGGPDWSDNLTVSSGSPGAPPASPPTFSVTSGGSITIEPPAGSTASASFDRLFVGRDSAGTVEISPGATVYSVVTYVGCTVDSPGPGMGTAVVDGGQWIATGHFSVGSSTSSGTVEIKHGGSVSAAAGSISGLPDLPGTVTVDGAGSTWTSSPGSLYVGGSSGHSILTVQNGGEVISGDARIGAGFNSLAAVTVDGADSTWTSHGALVVSFMGSGTLNIQNGGQVSSASGEIACFGCYPVGPPGTVTIDGPGSTWITSGGLYVNRGTLHLINQGSVSVGGTLTIRDGTLDVGPGDTEIDARVVNDGVVDVQEGGVLTFSGEVHGRGGFPGPGTIVFEDRFVPGGYYVARTVDFGGSVEFRPTSTLWLQLAGYPDEVRHDLIAVRGTSPSRLDGTLKLAAFLRGPAGGLPRLTEDVPIVQAEAAAVLKGQFASGPPRQYDPADPVPSHLGMGVFCRELTYVEAPGSVPEDPSYSRVTVNVFEALSGDNNGDGLVDGGDLDTLSTNWSLPADPADRVWTDGDTTGGYWEPCDGYADGQDLNDLLSNYTDPTPSALPGEASAVYDWTTGEFWISISGQVKSWVLRSPGLLNGPDNQAAGILPLETTLPLTSISNNPNTVGEGFISENPDFVLEPQAGVYLGVLTDPFTPLIDYDTEEPNFELEYVRGAGVPKQYGRIIVIPEPATLRLLAAALLVPLMWLGRAARRRSSAVGESLTRRAPPP